MGGLGFWVVRGTQGFEVRIDGFLGLRVLGRVWAPRAQDSGFRFEDFALRAHEFSKSFETKTRRTPRQKILKIRTDGQWNMKSKLAWPEVYRDNVKLAPPPLK